MAQLYHWPVPCTTCESPVEYHCNTCGDVLCSKCREIHLRSNAGRNHNVVLYSQRIEPNKPSLQCKDHPGHQCEVWCKKCNRAVCSECVTSNIHGGHRFLKFDEKIKERREEIQNQFDKYSSLLSEWQNFLQESEKLKAAYETDVKLLDKDIIDRADEICRQVRTMEKESRTRLQEMKYVSLTGLKDQQKTMTDEIQRLKEKIKLLEDILRSNDTSTIIQGPIEEIADTKPSFDLSLPIPVFENGSTNIYVLQEMFGSLSDKTIQNVYPKTAPGSLMSFQNSNPPVDSIINIQKGSHTPAVACVGSDLAWLQTAHGSLQLVNRQGTVKKTVKIDFTIRGMAVTPQGDILLPDYNNKCIRTMSMEGKIKRLFNTDWEPYGICCLPSGDIVLTFRDDTVVQYSSTGKVIKEIDRSLFKYPWYAAHSQANQQLYVSDKSNSTFLDAPGRVLAFDMNDRLQFTYTGSDQASFRPVAVCADQAGHVLITDWKNNKVHILDEGGNFLRYLLTEEEGLTSPETLGVDSEGYAWIGERNSGQLKVVKYMQIK